MHPVSFAVKSHFNALKPIVPFRCVCKMTVMNDMGIPYNKVLVIMSVYLYDCKHSRWCKAWCVVTSSPHPSVLLTCFEIEAKQD